MTENPSNDNNNNKLTYKKQTSFDLQSIIYRNKSFLIEKPQL